MEERIAKIEKTLYGNGDPDDCVLVRMTRGNAKMDRIEQKVDNAISSIKKWVFAIAMLILTTGAASVAAALTGGRG